MIRVVCLFLLNGAPQKVPGELIETRGDNWVVAFSKETKTINSNQCLITGGKK